ncbi:MAG: hypothetical protein OHK0029_12520 [Armatimonadaceae bacterium]
MTDLETVIHTTPLIDTHEHQVSEAAYLKKKPDILQALFGFYTEHDLRTAGASNEAIRQLMDPSNPDIAARFRGVQDAWEATAFTGYGEGVRLAAKTLYGIEEITPESLSDAAPLHQALLQPGERLRLLRDIANLDHVQIDDFVWECLPDPSGPEFFLYDISWLSFAAGRIDLAAIERETVSLFGIWKLFAQQWK